MDFFTYLSVALTVTLRYSAPVPVQYYSTISEYTNARLAPDLLYAKIVRTRDRVLDYQLTREDVIWAAKAAAGEGDPGKVLWALTQRFVLTRPGRKWPTFTAFIRNFAQPINPDWYRGGVYCRPGGKGRGTGLCNEKRYVKRAHLAAMTWQQLKIEQPEAVEVTLQWAQGQLANKVPRAVNFAVPKRVRWYMKRHPDARIVRKARNWFLSEMGSRRWHPNTVIMRQPQAGTIARAEPEAYEGWNLFWRAFLRPLQSWGKRRV